MSKGIDPNVLSMSKRGYAYRRLFDAESIMSYAENDGDFSDRYLRPFLLSLVKRKVQKRYDQKLALSGFRKIADMAAHSYYKEAMAQEPGIFIDPWHVIFHPDERKYTADLWEEEFSLRYRRGEYDRMKNQIR